MFRWIFENWRIYYWSWQYEFGYLTLIWLILCFILLSIAPYIFVENGIWYFLIWERWLDCAPISSLSLLSQEKSAKFIILYDCVPLMNDVTYSLMSIIATWWLKPGPLNEDKMTVAKMSIERYRTSTVLLPMRSTTKSHYGPTTGPGASRPLRVSAVGDAVENTPLNEIKPHWHYDRLA